MDSILQEWIDKAEADFRVASRESKVKDEPSHDAVCFHAQQCVEKLIKAYLVKQGIDLPKTHDLVTLLELAEPTYPLIEAWRGRFDSLTTYATDYRYPGEFASLEEAREAYRICERFRPEIMALLTSGVS